MKPLLNNISHALGAKQTVKLKYLSVSRTRGALCMSACLVSKRVEERLYSGHPDRGQWNACDL